MKSKIIRNANHEKGFTLILTISLMVLLTVIGVGFLSLSTISLRTSSHGASMAEARSNARMSLMIALGELQKAAGLDTRVTARADILNASNPMFLGVWQSWEGTDHDATGRPIAPNYALKNREQSQSGKFIRWLVSGDTATVSSISDPKNNEDGITLVGSNSIDENASSNLQIKVEPSYLGDSKNPKGAYAWWIGGENQKARLPKLDSSNRSFTTADRVNAVRSNTNIDPNVFDMGTLTSNPELASKAVTLKEVDLISPTNDSKISRKYFYDLSVVSRGLLTNTATGGWRKDLSLFTETFASQPTANLPLFRLTTTTDSRQGRASSSSPLSARSLLYPWSTYRAGTTPKEMSGAVASWANLANYATKYASTSTVTSTPLTSMGNNSKYLHEVPTRPIVARIEWLFSYYGRTAPNNQIMVGVMMRPIVTLWNPYNVTLNNVGDLYFTVGSMKGGTEQGTPFPLAFKHTVTDGDPTHIASDYWGLSKGSKKYNDAILSYAVKYRTFLRFQIPAVEIPSMSPGSTVVFSPESKGSGSVDGNWKYPYVNFDTPAGDFNRDSMILKKGYKATDGGYFYFFPILQGGANLEDHLYVKKTVANTAKITLDVKFDNQFELIEKAGTIASGMRLTVRADKNNPQSDGNEMNYQVLIPSTRVNTSSKSFTCPTPVSELENTNNPFLSMVTGLRLASNTYASNSANPISLMNTTYAPSKGYIQSSPLATYTAMGGLDAATSSIGRAYPGTGHEVNSSMGLSYFTHTGYDTFSPQMDANSKAGYLFTGFQQPDALKRFIAADLPVTPLASLGDLQNWDMRYGNPVPPFSYNVIANSDASPLLPQAAVVNTNAAPTTNLQHDDSYCANHVLFDDWFFSTINKGVPNGFGGQSSTLTSIYGDFLSGKRPLVNTDYQSISDGAKAANVTPADAWRNIASHLEVNGMFNVNSTSINAWRALLRHALGQEIPYYNGSSNVVLSGKIDHAISRSGVAADPLAGSGTHSADFASASEILGFRKATPQMLDDLATNIVEQVRKRGPFLSLSEFVNRQLSNNKELAIAGAIQVALNNLTGNSNLNQAAEGSYKAAAKYSTSSVVNADYKFPDAANGIGIYGMPGWIRQADVLRPLAPILSARDDTFTIRAYGDARDSTGKVIAKAYCEAVVSRSRNYVDPADAADLADFPTSANNQYFGRRFDIISFQWLSNSEI